MSHDVIWWNGLLLSWSQVLKRFPSCMETRFFLLKNRGILLQLAFRKISSTCQEQSKLQHFVWLSKSFQHPSASIHGMTRYDLPFVRRFASSQHLPGDSSGRHILRRRVSTVAQPWHSRGKRTMAAAMVRNDADLPFLLWKHIWKLSVWCRSHRRSQNQISRGFQRQNQAALFRQNSEMTLLSWLPSEHLGVSTPRHIFWDGSARSDVSWCAFPRAQRRQLRAWFQWTRSTQSTRSTRHHKEDTWSLPDPKISKASWEEWWVCSAFPHSAKSVAWPWRSMEHQLLIIFHYRV